MNRARFLGLPLTLTLCIPLCPACADDAARDADKQHVETLNADALDAAERQEQADLDRLRAVNSGELELLTVPAAANALQTEMHLILSAQSLADGWVDMRQCQSRLDAMASSEIVYRYSALRDLRMTRANGIESAWVEDQSVQLRGVRAGAEVCVAAQVKILRRLENGHYRLRSGPYHRRFFDGYFPMHLSLEVRYPAGRLEWRQAAPAPQPGFDVRSSPGRIAVETHFSGMLTVELDFAAAE